MQPSEKLAHYRFAERQRIEGGRGNYERQVVWMLRWKNAEALEQLLV